MIVFKLSQYPQLLYQGVLVDVVDFRAEVGKIKDEIGITCGRKF